MSDILYGGRKDDKGSTVWKKTLGVEVCVDMNEVKNAVEFGGSGERIRRGYLRAKKSHRTCARRRLRLVRPGTMGHETEKQVIFPYSNAMQI